MHALTNWKTTVAGVAAILGAAADALTQVSTGHVDPTRLYGDAIAVVTGWGLIVAKDGNVTGGSVKQ